METPTDNKDVRTYISNLTHQLKSPLTTIHLYSEALDSGSLGELNKEQKNYVNEIYQASERMIVLINTLRKQADERIT